MLREPWRVLELCRTWPLRPLEAMSKERLELLLLTHSFGLIFAFFVSRCDIDMILHMYLYACAESCKTLWAGLALWLLTGWEAIGGASFEEGSADSSI